MTVSVTARSAPAKATAVSTPHRHKRAKATAVSDNRAAWSAEPDHNARGRWRGLARQRVDAQSHTSATTPHWYGGHRRVRRTRPRCPWAVAGPGQASRRRAERSSRRGRRAGGPPPTGTPSSPAPQPGPPAPGTPVGPQATSQHHTRMQKRPPGTGWAYLSRLWESNPRPIHYE